MRPSNDRIPIEGHSNKEAFLLTLRDFTDNYCRRPFMASFYLLDSIPSSYHRWTLSILSFRYMKMEVEPFTVGHREFPHIDL